MMRSLEIIGEFLAFFGGLVVIWAAFWIAYGLGYH
jgi:hypothetical protein